LEFIIMTIVINGARPNLGQASFGGKKFINEPGGFQVTLGPALVDKGINLVAVATRATEAQLRGEKPRPLSIRAVAADGLGNQKFTSQDTFHQAQELAIKLGKQPDYSGFSIVVETADMLPQMPVHRGNALL